MSNRLFTVGPRINKILQRKGIKQIELIRFLVNKHEIEGKERTQFSRYLKGIHEYPLEYLTRTADFLRTDLKALLEEKTENIPASRKVPLIGTSSLAVPTASFFSDFSKIKEFVFYAGEEEKIYAIKSFDDAMEPFINEDDEIALFEPVKNSQIKDGDVVHFSYTYGVNHNGIRIYKKRDDGNVYLKPLNIIYNDLDVRYPEFLKMSRLILILRKPRKF